MKVRFHVRSEVNGRIVDAGDAIDIPDDFPMHGHMQNIETGEFGGLPTTPPHSPVFLDHTGDAYADRDGSSSFNPALLAAWEKRG